MEVRWTLHQASTDALHTTTPTATFSIIHIYIYSKKSDGPPVLTHEVTNTKFEMKNPKRLFLTSSGQEWQFHIATDI